jgi:hypothetical protein
MPVTSESEVRHKAQLRFESRKKSGPGGRPLLSNLALSDDSKIESLTSDCGTWQVIEVRSDALSDRDQENCAFPLRVR